MRNGVDSRIRYSNNQSKTHVMNIHETSCRVVWGLDLFGYLILIRAGKPCIVLKPCYIRLCFYAVNVLDQASTCPKPHILNPEPQLTSSDSAA